MLKQANSYWRCCAIWLKWPPVWFGTVERMSEHSQDTMKSWLRNILRAKKLYRKNLRMEPLLRVWLYQGAHIEWVHYVATMVTLINFYILLLHGLGGQGCVVQPSCPLALSWLALGCDCLLDEAALSCWTTFSSMRGAPGLPASLPLEAERWRDRLLEANLNIFDLIGGSLAANYVESGQADQSPCRAYQRCPIN